MRYQLSEKLWSLGSKYVISDESGNPAYTLEGKVFSWGDKLVMRDASGAEVATISQKLMTMRPNYEIHRQGELFARVTQEFAWFKKKFALDVPGPNDYTINGSFWEHEYSFERSGSVVASVSRKHWSLADCYGVDISEGQDDEAILATMVVIDLVCNGSSDGATF